MLSLPLLLFLAQSGPPVERPKPALISGTVVNDQNGAPLRRAQVSIIPRISGLSDTVVETNDAGEFVASNIEPGQYGLQAVRDGFLPGTSARKGPYRLPRVVNLNSGEEIQSVVFRLQPWSVLEGKIRFQDDAEPALGVPVVLYKKIYYRAKQLYVVAGQGRTDDRGYFRIHGVAPGTYVLAAVYNKPTTKLKDDDPLNAPAKETSYATVYYPSGLRLADALPLRVYPGQELTGLDMFLEKVHTVRVSGRLVDGCRGSAAADANLEVLRSDEGGATLATNAEIRQSGGSFLIRGLTPGNYILTASLPPIEGRPGCPARNERYEMYVSHEPIHDVQITLRNNIPTRFAATIDDQPTDGRNVQAKLEPRSPGRPIVSVNAGDSRDTIASLMWREVYDIFVDRQPSADMYQTEPYSVQAGASIGRIRLSTHGARIVGTVTDDKKKLVPGATITVIPESMTPQLFREGYVDQYGNFIIRGLAPGRYVVVPWMDTPPCEFNNPAELESCRSKGKTVTLKADEQSLLELDLNFQ
jgi:hypothetical protein